MKNNITRRRAKITLISAAIALGLGLVVADDGEMLSKAMTGGNTDNQLTMLPEDVGLHVSEAEHAFTGMMKFYVPAQQASGAPAGAALLATRSLLCDSTQIQSERLHKLIETGGITGEDLTDMTGEPMIKFYNQVSGEPVVFNAVSYDVTGDPGIKAGVEDAMQAKIGEVVGFFLYKSVAEQGSNAIFDIVGMRFGRVMQVELSGSVGGGNTTMKAIIIQKVAYYGPDIMTSSYVPSTDRTIGRLELVR